MHVELKPKIAAILQAQVAAGHFDTIEDAVSAAVLGIGPDQNGDPGDLSWAKPYIDKGLADIEAGRVVPAETVHAELRRRFRTGA